MSQAEIEVNISSDSGEFELNFSSKSGDLEVNISDCDVLIQDNFDNKGRKGK